MSKVRLEAFSDGVIAILITIMVLELKVPHGSDWSSLRPTVVTLSLYVLSFLYLGIYWSNHHHMFHTVRHVSGGILWANLHLLFWLSLIPFATAWMGENHFAALPTSMYGVVLLAAAIAYTILQSRIIAHHGRDSTLAVAVGADRKGKLSIVLCGIGIAVAPLSAPFAAALYAVVALMWLVPDKRIESTLAAER